MRVPEQLLSLRDGTDLRLRSPRVYEAESLLAYVRTLHRESWRNLVRPADGFDRVTVPEEEAMLEGLADHPRSFFLAAFDGTRIVGTLGLRAHDTPLAVHCATLGMGVLAAYQGRGVGRAMLRRALEVGLDLGVWNVQLHVRTFNLRAIALYEDLGFERIGRIRAAARIADEWADEFLYQRVAGPPLEIPGAW